MSSAFFALSTTAALIVQRPLFERVTIFLMLPRSASI